MRKNKKLLLASVAAMGALALGVGATSTFAWFNATNASAAVKSAGDTISVTNAFSFGNYAIQYTVTSDTTVDLSEASTGKTFMYTPGGLVEKTGANPLGDWSISSLSWFVGNANLDGVSAKDYVLPADDVIDAMAAAGTTITLTASRTGTVVLLAHNAEDAKAAGVNTTSIVVELVNHGTVATGLRFQAGTSELALSNSNQIASGKYAVRPIDGTTGGDYLPGEFGDYATNTAYSAGDLIKNGDNYYKVTADIEAASNTGIGTVTKTEVTSGVHLNDGITVAKAA